MILIDFSQILISSIIKFEMNIRDEYDENTIRAVVLTKLLYIKNKFSSDYGEIVVCLDDVNYWRKKIFPYYKASRKIQHEKSPIDWNKVLNYVNVLKIDFKKVLPYRIIQIPHAEADDVIASIVQSHGNTDEKFMIISGDKDFSQLQVYENVKQYDAINKRFISCDDSNHFLFIQICKGDTSDGIPNIFSPDNFFIMKKDGERQKSVSAKKIEEIKNNFDVLNDVEKRNFERNKKLIDLKEVPENIKKQIINKYNEPFKKDRGKLLSFLMEHKLMRLIDRIREF